MRNFILLTLFFLLNLSLSAQLLTHWESRAPMPVPRSNMATASLEIGDTTWIYTFMGIDSTKSWSGISLEAYKYNTISDEWSRIADVPDTEGRIAASATAWNGKIYLMGGYKVYQSGNEYSSPRVDIYDPQSDSWSQGDSIPVPTDDHLQFLYRDSLIYLVTGWSQSTNIRQVQLYDPANDAWSFANTITGPGLFGLCGAISGDSTVIYLDGVRVSGFNFVLENKVWLGRIQPGNPQQINWTNLGTHPGNRVYRGGGFAFQDRVIFTGGTSNAYNIDGIGYNGTPAVESGRTFGYNLTTQSWEEYARNPDSAMDVREVVQVGTNQFYVVGGMEANQTVTNKVSVLVVDSVLAGIEETQFVSGWHWQMGASPLEAWLVARNPGQVRWLQIIDLQGREMAVAWKQESNHRIRLDISWLKQGMYLFHLEDEKGRIQQGKIIR